MQIKKNILNNPLYSELPYIDSLSPVSGLSDAKLWLKTLVEQVGSEIRDNDTSDTAGKLVTNPLGG